LLSKKTNYVNYIRLDKLFCKAKNAKTNELLSKTIAFTIKSQRPGIWSMEQHGQNMECKPYTD